MPAEMETRTSTGNLGRHHWRLIAGAILAPVFYLIVLVEILTRDGFDISRHPISSLALGDNGWIQVANFIITGALALVAASGLRTALAGAKGGRFGPLLVGLYGVGIIVAGIFKTDPALGFPPGTPNEMPNAMSSSAAIHSLGFFVAFGSLTVACFVVARRFEASQERRWRWYSFASGMTAPLLIILGMVNPAAAGVFFALAGIVAFGWLSVISGRLARVPLGRPSSIEA